jgi:hypothetical protein
MDHTPTTAGPAALQAYLEAEGINLNQFCNRSGLDYPQVHRLINGVRGKRVSVDFAAAVEDATGGRVPARLWCQQKEPAPPAVQHGRDSHLPTVG